MFGSPASPLEGYVNFGGDYPMFSPTNTSLIVGGVTGRDFKMGTIAWPLARALFLLLFSFLLVFEGSAQARQGVVTSAKSAFAGVREQQSIVRIYPTKRTDYFPTNSIRISNVAFDEHDLFPLVDERHFVRLIKVLHRKRPNLRVTSPL